MKLTGVYEFQNISCYCLSISDCCCTTQRSIFQNISCYCLSVLLRELASARTSFQNISCYCLSAFDTIDDANVSIFQNISCYCLSSVPSSVTHTLNHFKTSHVIVYPSHFRVFSFSPPLFPLIFSIFLHFLPANTLILDRTTYHPINLLFFQAFLDFSFFFRLVKIL